MKESKEFSMIIPDSVVELLDDMIHKRKFVFPESKLTREEMVVLAIQQYYEENYKIHLVEFT